MLHRTHRLTMLVLVLGAIVFSASSAQALVEFGLTGGLDYSSLNDVNVGDRSATYDNRTGYHLGGYLHYTSGPLGVRAGALYVNAGRLFEGLSDDSGVAGGFDDTFDVTFFSVPVDVQYRMMSPAVKGYFLLGPEFLFNTTSSSAFEDNFKSATMAGNVGLGLEVGVPGLGFTLAPEIRYQFSIGSITDQNFEIGGVPVTTDETQKIRAWMLRLHVGF